MPRLCPRSIGSYAALGAASLVLLVAACSHDPNEGSEAAPSAATAEPGDPGTSSGSSGNSSGGVIPDAGVVDATLTDTTPAPTCPAAKPTSYVTWKAPPARQTNRCNSSDITFFNTNLEKIPPADLETQMRARNANCGACVYSAEADAAWTPMVKMADGTYLRNFGACFARRQNGTNACGEAIHVEQLCLTKVCLQCTVTQFDTCTETAMTAVDGACKGEVTTFQTTCDNGTSNIYSQCLTIGEGIGLMCGGI